MPNFPKTESATLRVALCRHKSFSPHKGIQQIFPRLEQFF